ncbi:HlyD family efflux transporter periplasmic adaptor subunit [Laribacter hongkongensis]|uniref:HlyD family efflux transporter periplasmic adaptor subunit n=1 Tax=Laribacter hongkongensis TaxID=168471 RepID=A0ABD4SPM1_9NEIS|nr:HlyD family efflux transporter periplasmic adaptor subunit [Laribacter hongkongensis]MCG9024784.1 HlyD family efflux transporter periplasmic adaptor subunit [Laribacter hongkongensis]MCG9100821.1 HlyD family efflux transporter periplasmic adaptor subunit [Laribacter hongkongensis]MCG9102195.1 HlyD family efflux transporter periplasmic adaptor subunit [Laribacter hongkongensis]MCG9112229.1 HlyD family efflux transporter periplasmic adaptor subunit [Laribacter hongkongensis]MCG9117890.1 HlyD 
MMKSETRRWLVRGLAVAGVVLVALLVWKLVYSGGEDGRFARGNGRIEATEVDVAAKSGGRVAEILVNEGDFVQAGQLVARMDQASLAAQLTQAQAQLANARSSRETMLAQVAQREADVVMAEAVLVQRRAELDVSGKTHARSKALLADRATSAQQVDDDAARLRNAEANVAVAKAQIAAARAALQAARAQVVQAQAGIDAAEAVVKRLEIDLADGDLHAPRAGRVQYRIVQPGEVIAGGGKVVSLADIADVYMTFFLPEQAAGKVGLGSDVHIVLDAAPQYVLPARVSYVASVAQFTPKSVETQDERQKMVFRVKARLDPALLKKYAEHVKTGLPGMAYVRLDPAAAWPAKLEVQLP